MKKDYNNSINKKEIRNAEMKKMTVSKYEEIRNGYEYTENNNEMIVKVVKKFYSVRKPSEMTNESMIEWLAKNKINGKELNSMIHEYYFDYL